MECERMASLAKDADARALFVECAKQWNELALQKEDFKKNPPRLP
jgi:hypothetical protein